jgi:hypothetical protein
VDDPGVVSRDVHPGVRTSGGVTYRTFCGPARATLHLGGKTYRYSGDECERTGTSFAINLGTITLPPGSPKYRYFGIAVFTGNDRTYKEQAVALQFPGGKRTSLFHAKIGPRGWKDAGNFRGEDAARRDPRLRPLPLLTGWPASTTRTPSTVTSWRSAG